MTRSSTSIGWPSRPSSYGASLRVLLVFLAALVVALGSGLVDTQKAGPGTPDAIAATRSNLSALSCTFVARSPAGAYSFSARKWQSSPPSPEAGLEAVEADVDDADAGSRELVRNAHGDGHSPLVTSSRARSVGRVHRTEQTRVASRYAADSCPTRGPPA